jgi:hypothetical protein
MPEQNVAPSATAINPSGPTLLQAAAPVQTARRRSMPCSGALRRGGRAALGTREGRGWRRVLRWAALGVSCRGGGTKMPL